MTSTKRIKLFSKTLSFLPVVHWKSPSIKYGHPTYRADFSYYGLGWVYFSCLFHKDNYRGNLKRTVWFKHLRLRVLMFIFYPYIKLNNYFNL